MGALAQMVDVLPVWLALLHVRYLRPVCLRVHSESQAARRSRGNPESGRNRARAEDDDRLGSDDGTRSKPTQESTRLHHRTSERVVKKRASGGQPRTRKRGNFCRHSTTHPAARAESLTESQGRLFCPAPQRSTLPDSHSAQNLGPGQRHLTRCPLHQVRQGSIGRLHFQLGRPELSAKRFLRLQQHHKT
jgi:hypothetical protein